MFREYFRVLITQFRSFFTSLTPVKKMSLMASVIAVVGGILATVYMASGSDYTILLTEMPADQVSMVTSVLQQKNVPYIIQNGKTILVPKNLLHSTQMTIMSEVGSGKLGQVGLELFDKQDFGTTSYAQKINFQRALQGELIRAINSLEAVVRSKVILAIPEKKAFLEEGGVPTASVVVELRSGKKLSEEQVMGITYLVSNSVEGMQPENVSVLDSKGAVLSKKHDPDISGSAELMDVRKKIESYYQKHVESILTKIVGEGKVVARVSADLNPQKISMQEEIIDPDKTAIKSIQTEEEGVNGNRSNPTGVPGARANLPGADEAGKVSFNQSVNREIKMTNYEVPKIVRNVVEAAGTVQKLSVAILVDGIIQRVKGDDGKETDKWVPRPPEEVARIENLVKTAIGFNANRGDSVKVESMQFKEESFEDSEKLVRTLYREKLIRFLASWVLSGLALVMLFFLLIRPFIRWMTDSLEDSVEDMLPRTIEELEELQGSDNILPGMSTALPMLDDAVDPEKAESELLKERIMSLMQEDKEKAAGAFSLWLVRRDQ